MDRKAIDLSKVEFDIVSYDEMPVGAVEVAGEIFAMRRVVMRLESEFKILDKRERGSKCDDIRNVHTGGKNEAAYLKHEFEIQVNNLENKLWDRYGLLIDENGEIVVPMDKGI